jgi:hypothetical protein
VAFDSPQCDYNDIGMSIEHCVNCLHVPALIPPFHQDDSNFVIDSWNPVVKSKTTNRITDNILLPINSAREHRNPRFPEIDKIRLPR